MTLNVAPYRVALLSTLLFGGAVMAAGCARNADALTPQQLQQQYGITDGAGAAVGALTGGKKGAGIGAAAGGVGGLIYDLATRKK